MDSRPSELIRLLDLEPHPEGGYFREVFRSPHLVHLPDKRGARKALTTIYFLLVAGEPSYWHRVASDEVWHFYEGMPLELHCLDPGFENYHRHFLGAVEKEARPVTVIPAGSWQAARTTGAYTLVGCTVGPGFDFADFQMLRDNPEKVSAMKRQFPELALLL